MLKVTFQIYTFIIYFYCQLSVFSKEYLVSSEFQNPKIQSSEVQSWSVNKIRTCEQSNIVEYTGQVFGVFSNDVTLQKKVYSSLYPHWSVLIRLDIMLYGSVDQGEGDFVSIQLDNQTPDRYTKEDEAGYKICSDSKGFWGTPYNDEVYPYQKNITHAENTLTLQFNSKFYGKSTASDYEGYAFKHLSVYIDTCYETCLTCNGPTSVSQNMINKAQCQSCISGASKVNGVCKCDGSKVAYYYQCLNSCPANYVADENGICQISNCSGSCGTCSNNQCTNCILPSKLLQGTCQTSCPSYSVDKGTFCEDKIIGLSYGGYIFKGLYTKNFGDSEIQGQGVKLVNFKNGGATFSSCNGDRIIGGWNIAGYGSEIRRELPNIKPHWSLRIGFKYYMIDDWASSETIQVYLDETRQIANIARSSSTIGTNICGDSHIESSGIFDQNITHSSTSLSITIKNTINKDKSAFKTSFGIREFYVLIDYCQPICNECNAKGCTKCPQNTFLYYYNCGTDCPTGYWKNTSTNTCDLCAGNCLTCDISATSCLSCKPASYLSNKSCGATCPAGTAPNTATLTCDSCHANCKTCTKHADSSTCTSCDGTLFLTGTQCLSNCPDGQYGEFATHLCTSCNSACQTCKGKTNADCLSCAPGKLYQPVNNTCGTSCNSDQYINGSNCTSCESTCKQCSGGTSNNCTACKDRYLSGTQCLTTCPDKFYNDSATFTCKSCEATCFNCVGPLNVNCTGCTGNLYLNTGGKCLNSCPSGQFSNSSNNKCEVCDSNCLTCQTSKANCTTCKAGQYLDSDGVCKASCPGGKWPNSTTFKCENCNSNCKTCEVSSKDSCSSCSDPTYLDKNSKQCVNSCPSKFYGNKTTLTCDSCETTCKECNGHNSNQCIKCSGSLYLSNNNCISTCPPGTFGNLSDNTCTSCDKSKCAECISTNDQCTKCSSPMFLDGSQCIQTCPKGTYGEISNRKCQLCNPACDTCFGPNSSDCTNCKDGKYFDPVTKTCVVDCQSGYFKNASNSQCQKCDDSCKECTGPSNSECTLCHTNVISHKNQCISQCPEKYFKDPNAFLCLSCYKDCFKCTDQNQNSCIQCEGDLYLNELKKCEQICPEGFYANKSDNTCKKCDNSCKACSGPGIDKCTKCENNTYLEDSHCKNDCLQGWENPQNNECSPCNSQCSKCFGPDSDNCDECHDGSFLNPDNTCQNTCPQKYHKDSINKQCQECDLSCKNCTDIGQDQCTECDGNLFLKDGKYCSLTCNTNEFRNTLNNICQLCDNKCDTCSDNATKCTSCKLGTYLIGDNCEVNCPSGTFQNSGARQCQACNPECKSCTGLSKFECTSCASGTFLNKDQNNCVSSCPIKFYANSASQECEQCIPGCDNCSNNIVCQKCSTGFYLHNNVCETTCPDKYFQNKNNQECTQCHATCQSCIDDTKNGCQTCIKQTFLNIDDKSCRYNNECPPGKYPDSNTNLCEKCHSNCAECSSMGDDKCTACENTKVFYQGQCLNSCPTKTFLKDQNCIDCHNSCSSCSSKSSDSCTSCPSNQFLQVGKCIDSCTQHFYPTDVAGQKTCLICNERCNQCNGPDSTNCIDCQPQYFKFNSECVDNCPTKYTSDIIKECQLCTKNISNNQCVDKCNINEFTDPITLKCTSCSPQCASCNGPSVKECQSCTNGYFLRQSDNECTSDCPNKFYPDSQNRKCSPCDPSCNNCSSGSAQSCSSCILPLILHEGKCLKDTPDGYYKDDDKKTFEKCDQSCKTCDGPKPSNCLTCKLGLYNQEKQCLKECPDTYYNDQSTMSCIQCSGQCLNCKSADYCLSCLNKQYSFQGSCIQKCDSQTQYQDESKKECIMCHSECKNDGCTGPSELDCIDTPVSLSDSLLVKILAFKTVLWILCSIVGTILDLKNAKQQGKSNSVGIFVSDKQVNDLMNKQSRDPFQKPTFLSESKVGNRRKRHTFIRASVLRVEPTQDQYLTMKKESSDNIVSQDIDSPIKRLSNLNLSGQQSQVQIFGQQSTNEMYPSPTQRSPEKSFFQDNNHQQDFQLNPRPKRSTMIRLSDMPTFNNLQESTSKNLNRTSSEFSTSLSGVYQNPQTSYPSILYYTIVRNKIFKIGNELISVFSIYDPDRSRLFRATMIYAKYMILFLGTFISYQQHYGFAAVSLIAALAGKGLLQSTLTQIRICLRKSGFIAFLFIMGLIATHFYLWFIPKIKDLTYHLDLNWSLLYILAFASDFIVIQSMISCLNYIITLRSKFVDNNTSGNKLLNFFFKQPALLLKIK